MYEYSEFSSLNRFTNLDGIEAKIIGHLIDSDSEYAELFWKILKYDSADALVKEKLSRAEKIELVEGYNTNASGGWIEQTRLFFGPFVDDAWTKECSSVYLYVDSVAPVNAANANVKVSVETVIHSRINALFGDADVIANPGGTNPNDYYYTDDENPAVQYKSRATTLLKCILAELNGLYIDGIGYLMFDGRDADMSERKTSGATLSLFNNRSFFGHQIHFNVEMSGVSDNPACDF